MITRNEVARMAIEAKGGVLLPAEAGLPATWVGNDFEMLCRFAAMVEAHVIARQPPPPMVVDVSDADLSKLKAMLDKSPPMPLVPMPTSDAVRESVLAEREACRAECQSLADILREHNDISGAEIAESLAEAIAARGIA